MVLRLSILALLLIPLAAVIVLDALWIWAWLMDTTWPPWPWVRETWWMMNMIYAALFWLMWSDRP